MPCPHCKITIIKRSNNESAVSAAAYQSGEKLFSEYDQEQKYYPYKNEVTHKEIMLPPHVPPEFADRNTLWNSAEAQEKQWNSQLARRFVLAIPREIPPGQYADLIRDYCREFFVSKGMIADFAIHDKGDGNPHAHILLTMRAMDEKGKWLPKSRKVYDLDKNGERIRLASGRWKSHKENTVDWNNRKYAEIWRQGWADTANRYLEANDRPERLDLRSYARQGIDQIPTVHMGAAVTAMERRGIMTNIGNLNRDIKAANKLLDVLKRTIVRLISWLEEIRRAIAEIDMEPKEVPLVDLLVMSFEESITDRRGRKFTTQSEAEKFNSVVSYMRERDVLTVEDLDTRLTELNNESLPIRDQIKHLSSRIKTIEKLIEHGDRRASLDAVHIEYLNIHWKGKKEKFAREHKDELDAWKQSDRYMRKNLPDQKYNGEALRAELSSLTAELDSLIGKIRPHQEEAELLKEVRSYVKKLLPELVPDGEGLTPESRQEKIEAVQERLTKAKAEAERRAADYEKSRQTADRNDRGR